MISSCCSICSALACSEWSRHSLSLLKFEKSFLCFLRFLLSADLKRRCPLPVPTLYLRLPVLDALPLLHTLDGSLFPGDLRLVILLVELSPVRLVLLEGFES